MIRYGAKSAGCASSRNCARSPAGCRSAAARLGGTAAPMPPARNRNRRAVCARRAKCSTPSSSAIRNSNPSRPRSYRACEPRPTLLAQEVGEITVAQSIHRIGALAQRAKQLDALAEGLRHMFRLQGTRLIEGGRAAVRRGEIVEVDQKVVPTLLAAGRGLQGEHRSQVACAE